MRGTMCNQYKIGDEVIYSNGNLKPEGRGKIVKLHSMSCSTGVAEIKPHTGERKIARILRHVRKA